jgi:flagellar basal body-associated protein FliL
MLKSTKKKIRILWIFISLLAALGMVAFTIAPFLESLGR